MTYGLSKSRLYPYIFSCFSSFVISESQYICLGFPALGSRSVAGVTSSPLWRRVPGEICHERRSRIIRAAFFSVASFPREIHTMDALLWFRLHASCHTHGLYIVLYIVAGRGAFGGPPQQLLLLVSLELSAADPREVALPPTCGHPLPTTTLTQNVLHTCHSCVSGADRLSNACR